MFGGDTTALTAAVAYAKAHGGGTVAVSSQSGAAGAIIASGADVAGHRRLLRPREPGQRRVAGRRRRAGRIRWVLADGASGGGLPQDGRTGATAVMAAVRRGRHPVSSVSGLYDLQGKAAALRASAA